MIIKNGKITLRLPLDTLAKASAEDRARLAGLLARYDATIEFTGVKK